MARYVPPGRLALRSRAIRCSPCRSTSAAGRSRGAFSGAGEDRGDPSSGIGYVATGPDGSLAFVPGGAARPRASSSYGSQGRGDGRAACPAFFRLRASRRTANGSRSRSDRAGADDDVWIYEFAGGDLTRLTFGRTTSPDLVRRRPTDRLRARCAAERGHLRAAGRRQRRARSGSTATSRPVCPPTGRSTADAALHASLQPGVGRDAEARTAVGAERLQRPRAERLRRRLLAGRPLDRVRVRGRRGRGGDLRSGGRRLPRKVADHDRRRRVAGLGRQRDLLRSRRGRCLGRGHRDRPSLR